MTNDEVDGGDNGPLTTIAMNITLYSLHHLHRQVALATVFLGSGMFILPQTWAQHTPTRKQSTVADLILRHVDNPPAELRPMLDADSLAQPGGSWKAAAALQALLSESEKDMVLGERRRHFRGRRGRSFYPGRRGTRSTMGRPARSQQTRTFQAEEEAARSKALGLDVDKIAALTAQADSLHKQYIANRKALRELYASEADSTTMRARRETIRLHSLLGTALDEHYKWHRAPRRHRR